MRAVGILCAIALVGSAGCKPKPETPEQAQARMEQEAASARPQIEAVSKRWEGWVAAAQPESIAAAFTDRGYELPPNARPVMGHDGIVAFQTQLFSMGQWTVHISVHRELPIGRISGFTGIVTESPATSGRVTTVYQKS